ncbi:MAG: regulatory protein RecX [Burkholderiaceae bacterium]
MPTSAAHLQGRALGSLPLATQAALKQLRQRAIRLLARRDFSRAELARRLASPPAGRRRRRTDDALDSDVADSDAADSDAADSDAADSDAADSDAAFAPPAALDSEPLADIAEPPVPALAQCIEWVLDDLAVRGYLDDQRFARGLIRRESPRRGVLLLARKLAEHGLEGDDAANLLADARQRELARAHALWQRRFGATPADPRERMRQLRFLAQRGFSAEVVRKVVAGRVAPDDLVLPDG